MSSSRHRVPLEAGLPIATISGEQRLVFASASDFDHAWDVGIFYLRIPENLDLDDARQFGRELISLDSAYRQIVQYGKLEGFIALENNQQTKLALRRERWDQHYPADVAAFGRQLDTIGIAIIREVFNQSGIPETLWDRASGGYTSGGGDAFLNFVHYDTRNPDWGLRPHTDYGFITILDASAPGLQIEIDGQFQAVPILPDHLIINFGEALHFITAHSDRPVGAVVHRVLSQQSTDPIRHGIVYFANPDLDGILWQFDVRGEIKGSSSVEDLFALLEKNLIQNRK
ncbi:MAG: isopenicillin N synthase family oxygenase [Luminiphilus sp.]|jgi:isopenicillin N synthase-like dioxygenase|nr:isopenicillin N synthase family oxygenase [Luminiphilus sp.]MBL6897160.1 isopenicillin N synthase family oxygenase [Luminiphilus sp.]MDA8554046.1 isopenicillin N synthase family oxygenase [Luminiphilus sp.]